MSVRLRSVALASTALCVFSTPLAAQAVPVPPTRELIDGNGVDLFRGTFTVDETVASVGGNQGLRLRRIARGSDQFMYSTDAYIGSNGSVFFVTVNGRTDRFTRSGSLFTPTEGNGASLTFASNIYTYTARDGTIVTFSKALLITSGYQPYGNEGLVTAIVEPDGGRVDMTYQSKVYCEFYTGDRCTGGFRTARRLASAKSATGYMANLAYFSDDLEDGSYLLNWYNVTNYKLINLAVEYCQGNLPGCVTTNAWPGSANPNHLVNSYVSGSGVITGVRRPGSGSNDLTITYAGGKVASVADHGGATTYTYADAGGNRTVTVTNALSEASVYTFLITSERLTQFKDPMNNETNYTYDGNGRLTRITKPEGNYTNYTFDSRGNVTETRMVAKAGSGTADIVSSATFSATCSNAKTCNQPVTTTDPWLNVTDYTYDPDHGGVSTVTAPAPTAGAIRPQQRFGYVTAQAQVKSSGGGIVGTGIDITLPSSVKQCATQVACANGADEIGTTVTYGAAGVSNNLLPTQIASGSGDGLLTATTSLAYDAIGNLLTVDGPLPSTDDTTTAIYDGLRRPYGLISPDPDGGGGQPRVAQRSTFATNGDMTRTEIGTVTGTTAADLAAMTVAQGTDMVYDPDGRKLKDTITGGGSSHAVTQYSYDSEHRVTYAAQRMNPASWGSLPASACTLGTAGGFGPDRITKSLRDANGRVTTVQTAFGVVGQQADERIVAYSANGVIGHLIDANLNRTTYEYDGHDRLVKTRMPVTTIGQNASSTTDYEQFTLDPNGNVTLRRLRDAQGIAYTYDALNRMTARDLPGGEWDVTYTYDLPGRMTSAAKGPIPHSFTWDALSRQTTEGQI